jgi:hypothetical protein
VAAIDRDSVQTRTRGPGDQGRISIRSSLRFYCTTPSLCGLDTRRALRWTWPCHFTCMQLADDSESPSKTRTHLKDNYDFVGRDHPGLIFYHNSRRLPSPRFVYGTISDGAFSGHGYSEPESTIWQSVGHFGREDSDSEETGSRSQKEPPILTYQCRTERCLWVVRVFVGLSDDPAATASFHRLPIQPREARHP